MDNFIAVVDLNDEVKGFSTKTGIHQKGTLHRAFSIFVFNNRGELLLQQRSYDKYHSSGLWTNTCCSHLPMGMEMEKAVHVRLMEEMGFDTQLHHITKFHYHVVFENGLTENEIDHIYVGFYDQNPEPDSLEVSDYKWITLIELNKSIEVNPNEYTYWLKFIMQNHVEELEGVLKSISVQHLSV